MYKTSATLQVTYNKRIASQAVRGRRTAGKVIT